MWVPRYPSRVSVLRDTSYLGWGVFKMVVGLPFLLVGVSDGFEESAVVEAVHVLEGGVLEVVGVAPWSLLSDEFDLVQADDSFLATRIMPLSRADRSTQRYSAAGRSKSQTRPNDPTILLTVVGVAHGAD